ncbi:RecBCD enzyme subunit RecB [Candidatus Providencia siddallii]|uniref:RecBCD enzyme subunit RecB n=1 Tax=Candidatus Providencia siddallii TaxID=1715285 RepID=A0A0M6W843_9GAMM|nr:RecBCD enzyme subunit RecB [Candidatus Providencia siddallii]
MQTILQLLNIFSFPIKGKRLIEASAGTGKTYIIEVLYLRLLLGLSIDDNISKPLSVEKILIVTFTESATIELRRRIRQRIREMYFVCLNNGVGFEDKQEYLVLLNKLLQQHRTESAINLLIIANRSIDEISIYTIHSFCQRILTFYAFETQSLFEQTIIQNEYLIQKQAAADFWRLNFYNLNYSITKVIQSEWSSPEDLLTEIHPFLQSEIPLIINLPKDQETLENRHNRLIELIKNIKSLWLINVGDFKKIIINSDVDKRIYNKRFLTFWLIKINEWAKQKTENYFLPKELIRFSQNNLNEKSKNGICPKHIVFQEIEKLLTESFSIKDIVIPMAVKQIKQTIAREKSKLRLIGFDDLLINLNSALNKDNKRVLARLINTRFPVAMIDEFQDTDLNQYQIFNQIYQGFSNTALLFIGDPKQAIYSFRGANIFAYISVKKHINYFYTLDTNYRSTKGLVEAINYIFSRCEDPFIFKEIKFYPTNFAQKNMDKKLIHNGKEVKAFIFWYSDIEMISVFEYEYIISTQCADKILEYLLGGLNGTTYFLDDKNQRSVVVASDITVLVRSHREAKLIRNALNKVNISSVFQSNQENVFSTQEAKDLLWILQAIINPKNKYLLRTALASSILGLNIKDIEYFNHDESISNRLINEFFNYNFIWTKYGVLSMLRTLIHKRRIAEILLSNIDGERRMTNIIHISELLQENSLEFYSKNALIRWLSRQIINSDKQLNNQQIRLESDKNLVQINTIHKSKGLEYKIVWLPFASNFLCQTKSLYHDRKNFSLKIDLFNSEKTLSLADEERLAEDLRLLYVALTRAMYHCSIGVAPLVKNNRKKSSNTDIHLSALGYLLQKKQIGDSLFLKKMLEEISNENIEIILINLLNFKKRFIEKKNKKILLARKSFRDLDDNWKIISFSNLKDIDINLKKNNQRISLTQFFDLSLNCNINNKQNFDFLSQNVKTIQTIHQFPVGNIPGIFLHHLMEKIDFSTKTSLKWLKKRLVFYGFNEKLANFIQEWLYIIVNIRLNNNGLCLSVLKKQDIFNELEFYLPIKKFLKSKDINNIINKYDPLSQQCNPLIFKNIYGILKGFIDLVFFWNNKFYLLDYKSNYLGEDSSFYILTSIKKSMINHRYDLQYQLYTIAIHRYLKQKIQNYDYRIHFGGVYYLFLRGMENIDSKNGIFFYCPSFEFIQEFDKLF